MSMGLTARLDVVIRGQGLAFPGVVVVHGTQRARGDRGRRAHSPVVAVQVEIATVQTGKIIAEFARRIAHFDIVVVPAEHLVRLDAWEKSGLGEIECHRGKQTTTDQIHSIVVRKIHGGPPHPEGVGDPEGLELGEDVAHEKGCQSGIRGMERGERTKDHGRLLEAGGVQVDPEKLVNAGETGRVALHRVVCRGQAVQILIPRGRAREHQLDRDSQHANVAEGAGEQGSGARGTEDEENRRDDKWSTVMAQAVGDPRQNVQGHVLVGGKDVADVGTVQDVFHGWQHPHPDGRPPIAGDEPIDGIC